MTVFAYVIGSLGLTAGLLIVGWALYQMECPEDLGWISPRRAVDAAIRADMDLHPVEREDEP